MAPPEVIVVGAGVIGLCVAEALAGRGRRVVVLERGLPGAGSTTRTGGGLRQQFATPLGVRMSTLSAPAWATFARRTGVDPGFRPVGYLFLTRETGSAEALERQVEVQASQRVEAELLQPSDLSRRWPFLARRGFVAGAFRQDDGWADHHRIVDGLVRAVLSAGVDLQVGVDVTGLLGAGGAVVGVRTTAGELRAPTVVLATGAAVDLAAAFGVHLPVRGHRHQLLVAAPDHPLPEAMPWMIDLDRQVHQRPDRAGRVLVGGFLGHDDPLEVEDRSPLIDHDWSVAARRQAAASFGVTRPDVAVVRGWSGLYPSTPDRQPIIDEVAPGLVAVVGFSGTGLMHGPAAGRLAAELVCGGAVTSVPAAEVGLARFDAPGLSSEVSGF